MASNYFVQQPLTILSEQAVQTIHESALALLRRVGIRVASEEALGLLSDYPMNRTKTVDVCLCLFFTVAAAVLRSNASDLPAPGVPVAEATEVPDEKAEFLRLCDLAVVELSKDITPFLNHGDTNPKTHHVPFFEDSYAVRALAVAYDLTGKKEYLETCQRWCDRV